MLTAMFLYIVLVYLGFAAYLLRKSTAKWTYVISTTWTDVQHKATTYWEAMEWVRAYDRVECQVWIDGNQVR